MISRDVDVFWRSWTGADVEHLALACASDGVVAAGIIVAAADEGPLRARYRITCDRAWRVRELHVEVQEPGGVRTLALCADGDGRWATGSGDPRPALEGAIDVDLTATPFTNTLPIRRLELAPGDAASVPMVYVHVPVLEVERVEQRYTLLERSATGARWRFESLDSGFTAELPVDADGLVLDYPDLFWRLWPPPPEATRPPLVVVFIIEHEDRILLLRRSSSGDHAPGEWETGRGRVVPGERVLDAVVREVRAETGLDVAIVQPLDTFRFLRGAVRDAHDAITFHCRPTGGTLTLSAEHDQSRWVPLHGILDEPLAADLRRALARLLALRPVDDRGAGSRAP